MSSKIVIVLATFNGEAHLAHQLDSIRAQTLSDWMLLVRDDGSTDDTRRILKAYSLRDPRIQFLTDELSGAGSALGNFAKLMEAAFVQGYDYIWSCDQDDYWKPDKIELMLGEIQRLEGETCKPSLVHHDLLVVDQQLNSINKSFTGMMNINPGCELSPQRLISRNEVTGCAMAFNRPLLELALPIPKDAIMHDWWLALFAGFFGQLHFMPQALVKYRQHGNNAIGAKSFWHGFNPFTSWVKGWRRGNVEFMDTVKQAKAFRQAIAGHDIGNDAQEVLELYINLPTATRRQRLKSLRACNLWRSHWFLNAMLVLRMLLLPRQAA